MTLGLGGRKTNISVLGDDGGTSRAPDGGLSRPGFGQTGRKSCAPPLPASPRVTTAYGGAQQLKKQGHELTEHDRAIRNLKAMKKKEEKPDIDMSQGAAFAAAFIGGGCCLFIIAFIAY